MNQTDVYDVAVLGAGLAGLSVADAVLERGQSCAIADPSGAGGGASGAPMMLANPAAGRRAKKTWRADACLDHLANVLNKITENKRSRIFEQNGVLRPALTEKIARDFERSLDKYEWADGWIEWIPQKEFKKRYPFFDEHFGGLHIKKAFTVRGEDFTKFFLDDLKNRGCHAISSGYTELNDTGDRWNIHLQNGSQISATHVIDATGFHQLRSGKWNFLPLHPVKGQTATFHFDEPLPLHHSVSSLGYMAFMNSSPYTLTTGSTYEHNFDHLQPDDEGLSYLKGKLNRTLSGFTDRAISVDQWASVRVTVPDKKPVIGAHPHKPRLWFFGALGSKGLLMSRYLADMLIRSLFDSEIIADTVSIQRLF